MTDLQLRLIWESAKVHPSLDQGLWRIDPAGRLIHWNSFGNRRSAYGWEGRQVADGTMLMRAEHYKTNFQLATA